MRVARVIEQHRSGYRVDDGEREFAVQAPSPWTRANFDPELRAAVGDWVTLEPDADQIVELLPRFSLLKRGAAGEHYKQQLIAANVDSVLVACGLDGDFNPRRLERYRVLVSGSGAQVVFVLTKRDCIGDLQPYLEALQPLIEAGALLHAVNAHDRASVSTLADWLGPGQTTVLVGSSGAGKSTLTNTLLGRERQRTKAVRSTDSRGRHTTTHRALIRLPSGGCLIDTPGMRELKLTGEEDLDDAGFDEIDAIAATCRFRDCRHQAEPGCAVQEALDDGRIDAGQWGNYQKLQQELGAASASLGAQRARRAEAKPATRPPNKAPRQRRPGKFDEDL